MFLWPPQEKLASCCKKHQSKHPGLTVTKQSFSTVFKDAWIDTINLKTVINAFKVTGLCPLNPDAIDLKKIMPATVWKDSDTSDRPAVASHSADRPSDDLASAAPERPGTSTSVNTTPGGCASSVEALERMLDIETVARYERRLEEGFDIKSDTLYNVWKKLKLSVSGSDVPEKNSETGCARPTTYI